MRKRILSFFVVIAIVIIMIPIVTISANEKVERIIINMQSAGITDEKLLEMILSGEIPQNTNALLLADNKISDFSPLSKLKDLDHLSLIKNQITDISPLSELTNLKQLDLAANQITDITPLESLTNLQSLVIGRNQITDITPLSGLTNLGGKYNCLDIGGNPITDLSPLSNLKNLEWLCIDDTLVTDLTPLYPLKKLNFIDYKNVPVTQEQIDELYKELSRAEIFLRIIIMGEEPAVGDVLEILKHLAGMDSVYDDFLKEPVIADVLEILKHLAGMESALD
jgi:Leucine-rich repeat (LRR) protein